MRSRRSNCGGGIARLPAVALALVALASGADAPTEPRPIPKDRQEEISRALIRLQAAQLQLEKLLTPEIRKAQENADQENRALSKLYEGLRKEFSVPLQCYPDAIEKSWVQLTQDGRQVPCRAGEAKGDANNPKGANP
jgi:hypothetical protein